jgi:hypothetical protein
MSPTATLVLVEKVLPIDLAENPDVTFLDLDMMVEVGGRQRTIDAFARLLARHGLRLDRVIRRPTEPSLLVAVADI